MNFYSNSLISSIKELLEIVNGIPPLNYTIVPDIYKRVVENISEKDTSKQDVLFSIFLISLRTVELEG